MLDVYDLVADLMPGSCPRYYIRLSRKAVALVHSRNYLISAQPLAGKVGRKTVAEWLGNFKLEDYLVSEILKRAGLTGDALFSNPSRIAIKEACQSLQPTIEQAQIELSQMIKDFLTQTCSSSRLNRIGIIDSGWACTIQDSIRNVLSDTELISGMYIGVSHQGLPSTPSNLKYGILRDDFRAPLHNNPLEASAGVVRLWDTLLRETAGTVDKLIRYPDGKVSPVLKTPSQLRKLEIGAAESIRKGIHEGTLARRAGISLLSKIIDHFSEADFERAATAIARHVTTRPSRRTAAAIINLGFDEGTARGKDGSIGIKGLNRGVSWYSGILTKAGCGWISPLMEISASLFYKNMLRKK